MRKRITQLVWIGHGGWLSVCFFAEEDTLKLMIETTLKQPYLKKRLKIQFLHEILTQDVFRCVKCGQKVDW